MGGPFLSLSLGDQRDAYAVGAANLGRNETSLEKDVWVCWVLNALFTCPDLPAMAFKGGTSIPGLNPFEEGVSRTMRGRHGDELKAAVRKLSVEKVLPHLQTRLASLSHPGGRVRVEDDGETLVVEYPTALTGREQYYSEGVKLEFGGRNMTEPHEQHLLSPYLAAEFPDLSFVSANVHVLAGERTFWEKVTCGLWHCVTGQAKLLPDAEGRAALREDYEAMISAGMIEAPMSFDEVEAAVLELQEQLNALATTAEG